MCVDQYCCRLVIMTRPFNFQKLNVCLKMHFDKAFITSPIDMTMHMQNPMRKTHTDCIKSFDLRYADS